MRFYKMNYCSSKTSHSSHSSYSYHHTSTFYSSSSSSSSYSSRGSCNSRCNGVSSASTTTNGHGEGALFKPQCNSRVWQKKFYTKHDVVNLWNSLPPTVSFTSLSSFRQRYAMFFSGFMYCH